MKSKRDATRPPSTQVESTGASVLLGASSPSIHGGEICNSQRDQIRSTIIINLGGSDSDPSRATSGINKNNTPESAGGSSHASTSSTSDQKQSSIPEESSVSTDSGLDSCDASFEVDEIESPPSEGNTIEEEPSNSIYKRHMYLKKHGFPLWIPQPNLRLSCSYRRRGVSIGDVGIFTAGGGFDFLFNICLPARHPSNPDELPEGFYPLQLKPADVCEFHAHSSHSYIASSSVKKQGETFHCSDSDGALLVMPQGAHEEDLRNISKFRSYTSLHAESWYQYANGPCGREIGNAKLHLVTGCDKTTSWGIAAYSHAQSKCVEDDATLLNFNVSNEARHSLYPRFVWGQQGAADVKAGPEDDELIDLPEVHAVRPLRNQCTFIRSLTTALGVDDWERLQAKVTASADDRISTRSPESPLASVFGAVSSLTGLIGSFRGYSREGTSKLINSVSPEQILSAHPAAYVVDMLLQKCPKAKVVVVHDSDWCSVIRDSDDDWTYTAQDLPHRIQEAFHIVEWENGTVYLEEKIRPSQHLSTSSDVSVKLEVEDNPLFEDRKPGYFQPFDSFERSFSDMQVDSLRSKKVVDEGISDIKPNKHHDSSEDDKDLGNEGHSLLKGRKARSYLSASSVPLLLHNSLPSGSQGGRPIISNDGPTNQPSYSLNSNTQPNEAFFWPSAPNEFDAVNLGPAVQLQYNNEVLLQPHTPSSQSLRDLSAYPRTQSYPQTPPQIPTYTETSPIPKKRLYSYREQLNFFLQAEDLPTRTYGPFIPQPMYQPHTSSGWGRYMEEKIELEAPIYFSIDHPSEFGILLSDALHSRFNRLHNRDQLVFEGRGPSISIRLEWPGYRQWIWQIPTEDFRSPPGPITLSKLAEKVAECIQRFIEERKNQSPKDKSWKVGTGANHIKLEDLVLVSIHHVSLGSWQPQLRLKHQLPPWRG